MRKHNWSTESRHARGYGKDWDKARKLALARDFGMCQCERCKGFGRVADHVHHIVSIAEAKRLGWDFGRIHALANLISMNSECHDKEHNMSKRVAFDVNGFPIEK